VSRIIALGTADVRFKISRSFDGSAAVDAGPDDPASVTETGRR